MKQCFLSWEHLFEKLPLAVLGSHVMIQRVRSEVHTAYKCGLNILNGLFNWL